MWAAQSSAIRAAAKLSGKAFTSCGSNHAQSLLRMASTYVLPRLPIFEAIAHHDPKRTAVVHSLSGRSFTYGELLGDVAEAKEKLRERANGKKTEGERIAFLAENGYDYVGAACDSREYSDGLDF